MMHREEGKRKIILFQLPVEKETKNQELCDKVLVDSNTRTNKKLQQGPKKPVNQELRDKKQKPQDRRTRKGKKIPHTVSLSLYIYI